MRVDAGVGEGGKGRRDKDMVRSLPRDRLQNNPKD
jgi:hypothetical protein